MLCSYIIGIYGNPQSIEEISKYKLLIKHNETSIPLRENYIYDSYVEDGKSKYYEF
jgi:hypothetical protein